MTSKIAKIQPDPGSSQIHGGSYTSSGPRMKRSFLCLSEQGPFKFRMSKNYKYCFTLLSECNFQPSGG